MLERWPALPNALLTLLITAILASGAWLSVYASTIESRDESWAEAVEVMRADVFRAHLGLDDWADGDADAAVRQEVSAALASATSTCMVLAEGGVVGSLALEPFPEPEATGVLCADIAEFAIETELLLREDPTGFVDPDGPVEASFESVLADLQELDQSVTAISADGQSFLRLSGWVVTAGLAAMLASIVFVGRLQRRHVARLGRRNEVVLDAAAEGIYGLDAQGMGVFANPAAVALLGRHAEDLVQASAHDVLHRAPDGGEDHTVDQCPLLQALEVGSVPQLHADEFRRGDGSSFPVEYSAASVEDDDALIGGVVVFRDVTERRAVEEMKDQFISVVSHELRTPLTSIHGSLGLLSGGALGDMSPSAQRMLDIAATNTHRLVRLINDILDIERMRSGTIRMDREVIEATDVVEAGVASMRGMATEAGVELEVSTEPVLVYGDRDRLTQVVVNVVSNAIKFSSPGTAVTVTLRAHAHSMMLDVADRGRGIPEDQLTTVFGRFQQVDATDARDKGGTGLGLAICENIVTHHDGRIWAERRTGGGTVVRIVMPSAQRPEDVDVVTTRPTVLVVDDDPSVVEVVCSILEREGYHAVAASSGADAIDKAIRLRPSAMVLDLLMPDTNGWQVLGAVRDHPETADLPAVILSVLSESSATLSPGDYDSWVAKPFDDEHLVRALKRALAPVSDGVRAIIVEDDQDLAAVLMETFARHGIDARHAATAHEARAVVAAVDPHLIVLDLHLPDGDGVELLHGLRAAGHLQGVPVVVYTGYDVAPEDRERLDREGAIVFTKTRVAPVEFERRVLQLVGALVAPPSEQPGHGPGPPPDGRPRHG